MRRKRFQHILATARFVESSSYERFTKYKGMVPDELVLPLRTVFPSRHRLDRSLKMMLRDLASFPARRRFARLKSRGGSEKARVIPLSLVALGVVFGDIGTSPLYAFKECLRHCTTPAQGYRTVSLILWRLILLVSSNYLGIVMQAAHDDER